MILINSSPRDALKIFQPFLPLMVPIGVGCLVAAAAREKIPVTLIDEQVEHDVMGSIHRAVKKLEKPYVFGFSVLTTAFRSALSLSRKVREQYPDSVIVFGGIHPTALPEEVLSYPHIDVVVRGEGERALLDLYRCVKGKQEFRHIDNVSYRDGDRIVHTERKFILDDLALYPPFPYDLFDPKKYDLGFVVSSRGCPYQCTFCSNRVTTGMKYRFRPAGAIVDEIEMLHDKYGKTNVGFLDDNFLVNRQRIRLLIEEIERRGLHRKMHFDFQARADNVEYGILKDLYDAGARNVFFGLETSSETVMKNIKKGETVAQCIEAVKLAKQIGYYVSATFIYGLPGETHQDRMNSIAMSRELRLDRVRFNNATPYPGTELFELAKKEGRLNVQGIYENFISVSTFIENPFKPIPFTYVPEGSTEAEIRRDILFSYFSFYLDLEKMLNIFTSPKKGANWFELGGEIVSLLKKIPALAFLFLMLFVKFGQLFYYVVIKKETAISFRHFLRIFDGLWRRNKGRPVVP